MLNLLRIKPSDYLVLYLPKGISLFSKTDCNWLILYRLTKCAKGMPSLPGIL